MISNFSELGLSFSAVRDISIAAESNDITKISRTTKIFKRWIWFSGLLGATITVILSTYLSRIAFGNTEYTWAFILMSSTLLLSTLAMGNKIILQGMRRLRDIAKSTVIGSIAGLFTSIPLYYFFGIKGIVPAFIVAAITSVITTSYFARKIEYKHVEVSYKETFREGREMVKLGILMMISVLLGSLVTYLVNAFIRYKGGVSDVGLYQAGLSISNQFIGLVFVAMGTDYFPRLAGISSDNAKIREMANQQAEIVILIAAPLLIALLVLTPIIVRLLLSPEFLTIIEFIRWLAFGLLFKAALYSVGYIAFAKGDKKVFFAVDGIMGNTMTLIFNIIAYNFWGLKGMGISYLVSYVFFFIFIQILTKRLYSFTFTRTFYRLFLFFLILSLITLILTFLSGDIVIYFGGGIIFILSGIFSLRELDKRIGLKNLLIKST
jgi:O-antigen/teichoic acid export membrane protein